jgi:hypothetical protein
MSVLLLGIPQGTTTALLIVALLAWGLVPGPEMVSKHADVIFSIIWIQGSSAVIGTLVGLVLANQLALLARVRYSLLVPLILSFVLLGAFSTNRDPLDLLTVVSFGTLGYLMWRLGYPRPPMILGFVLGALLEKYLFRSMASYGYDWLSFPSVIILAILAFGTLALTLWGRVAKKHEAEAVPEELPLVLRFHPRSLLTLFFLAAFVGAIRVGWKWPYIASMMPVYTVAFPGLLFAAAQLFRELVGREKPPGAARRGYEADEVFDVKLDRRTEILRTLTFFSFFAGGAVAIWLFGMVRGLPLLMFLYTLIEGKEKWKLSLFLTAMVFLFVWGLFEVVLEIRWPPGLLFR